MSQVRPYAVSKGAALEVIVESCSGYSGRSRADNRADERIERESNLSDSPDALIMGKEGACATADDVRPSPARNDDAPRERLSDMAGRAESMHPDASAALDFILSIGKMAMIHYSS